MKDRSLTRVLIVGVLLANLACSFSFSAVAILHELHGRRRAFDVMLRGQADSLLASLTDAGPQSSVMPFTSDEFFVVLNPAGAVRMRSSNMPVDLGSLASHPLDRGYFDVTQNGKSYRVLRLKSAGNGVTQKVSSTVLYAASTDDLRHEAVEAAMYYTRVAVGLLLAITLLLIAFLRSRLAPLQELADRASRVSTDSWNFEIPQEALRTKELRPIAISIQDLLHRLKMAFERQKQFTGDAAHELKTSVAVLKTRLQLLSMRQRQVEEYEQGMEELLIDIRRMEGLIAGMLTLARVEGEATGQVQIVDLGSIVRAVAQHLQPMAVAKAVRICIEADSYSRIFLQKRDAEILCSNLMMNALQHSPPHSIVTISVAAKGKAVELRVRDRGEGIPMASREHIFERFFRVDPSRSRNTGGAGLGLAICKAIAERAEARVTVNSEPGGGTEVLVSFPREAGTMSLSSS